MCTNSEHCTLKLAEDDHGRMDQNVRNRNPGLPRRKRPMKLGIRPLENCMQELMWYIPMSV